MSAHIQYELDALNAATAIANVAKLGRQWVVAGLADMWAHCFRSHTDEVSDMQLTGDNSRERYCSRTCANAESFARRGGRAKR